MKQISTMLATALLVVFFATPLFAQVPPPPPIPQPPTPPKLCSEPPQVYLQDATRVYAEAKEQIRIVVIHGRQVAYIDEPTAVVAGTATVQSSLKIATACVSRGRPAICTQPQGLRDDMELFQYSGLEALSEKEYLVATAFAKMVEAADELMKACVPPPPPSPGQP